MYFMDKLVKLLCIRDNMDEHLNLEIKNLRAINKANIEINNINVIGGVNGSGKSTLSKLFYSFLKANQLFQFFRFQFFQ